MAGLKYELTTNDKMGYYASDINIYHANGSFVTNDSSYYTKIIRVTKGSWLNITAGNTPNVWIVSKVKLDGTFIEGIFKGGLYNFDYQVEEDGYLAITANITTNTPGIVYLHETNECDYLTTDTSSLGWRSGYTSVNSSLQAPWYEFSTSYWISNPIYLNYGDSVRVYCRAANTVAVILILHSNGEWERLAIGTDANTYKTYTVNASDKMTVFATARGGATDNKVKITISRKYVNTIDGIYKYPRKSITSLNQIIRPSSIYAGSDCIKDLPNNKNGTLITKIHNFDYVTQFLYQYSINKLLVRLLKTNGAPYNNWAMIGEPLFGKKVIGIGDSLMYGSTLGNSYTWLNNLTECGAIPYNFGINGNTIAVQNKETSNPAMVNRISTIHKSVPKADYFVLLGGANDRRLSVPLGSDASTNTSDFCGALNSIIDQVRRYWPQCHIVFMTNYHRDGSSKNAIGLSDIDYVNAMLRVCAKKHIFCYDNYHNSGVNFDDTNFSAWADEGIYKGETANRHFSPAAYKWLYPKYKALLESN